MFTLRNLTRAAMVSAALANTSAGEDTQLAAATTSPGAANMAAVVGGSAVLFAGGATTTTTDAPQVIADAIADAEGKEGLKEGFTFDETANERGEANASDAAEAKAFFAKCEKAKAVDFKGFDKATTEKCYALLKKVAGGKAGGDVEEAKAFFAKCEKAKAVDFKGFDKATTEKCYALLKKVAGGKAGGDIEEAKAGYNKGSKADYNKDTKAGDSKDAKSDYNKDAKADYTKDAKPVYSKHAKSYHNKVAGGKASSTAEADLSMGAVASAAATTSGAESPESPASELLVAESGGSDAGADSDSKAKWLAASVVALVAVVGGVLVAAGMRARNMGRATTVDGTQDEARVCANGIYDATA